MLIGVESGTKLLTDLVGLDKEYVAEIIIGQSRSTGDMEGEITAEKEYEENLTDNDIGNALADMIGDLTLPVSAYSAIKKDGVPMYKRARQAAAKGELVKEVPVRLMRVFEAELMVPPEIIPETKRLLLKVRFKVSSGTYIRSLAEELGRRLYYPATLANLRRTKIGSYIIEEAKQLEDFNQII